MAQQIVDIQDDLSPKAEDWFYNALCEAESMLWELAPLLDMPGPLPEGTGDLIVPWASIIFPVIYRDDHAESGDDAGQQVAS